MPCRASCVRNAVCGVTRTLGMEPRIAMVSSQTNILCSMFMLEKSLKKSLFSFSYTSRPRAAIFPETSPSIAARASTSAPLLVLIKIAPRFIFAMAYLSISPSVSGVRGRCRDTTSLLSNTSSKSMYSPQNPGLFGNLSKPRTFIWNPRLRISATPRPIFPVPNTPTVFPLKLLPTSPSRVKFPIRKRSLDAHRWRFSDSIIATAYSLIESGSYAGTRKTVTPRSTARSQSTLSQPAHRSRMSRTP
mmetsp:Transcript_9932/g.36918  ORF Transcript_9932/g.36918 Transcript_9932/m.36918 type:complete len:246 (+) Transcript_9932:281-1018(+)